MKPAGRDAHITAWDPGRRLPIGSRWSIASDGTVRIGWPPAGHELAPIAMGWVAANDATGVIEFARIGVNDAMLHALDRAFPNRRWFEASHEAPEQAGPLARAA